MEQDPYECYAFWNFEHATHDELVNHAKELQEYAPNDYLSFQVDYFMEEMMRNLHPEGTEFMRHVSSMPDSDLKVLVGMLERERLKENLVCSCWFRGPDESDAM